MGCILITVGRRIPQRANAGKAQATEAFDKSRALR
jgi:hypothetical protein